MAKYTFKFKKKMLVNGNVFVLKRKIAENT